MPCLCVCLWWCIYYPQTVARLNVNLSNFHCHGQVSQMNTSVIFLSQAKAIYRATLCNGCCCLAVKLELVEKEVISKNTSTSDYLSSRHTLGRIMVARWWWLANWGDLIYGSVNVIAAAVHFAPIRSNFTIRLQSVRQCVYIYVCAWSKLFSEWWSSTREKQESLVERFTEQRSTLAWSNLIAFSATLSDGNVLC